MQDLVELPEEVRQRHDVRAGDDAGRRAEGRAAAEVGGGSRRATAPPRRRHGGGRTPCSRVLRVLVQPSSFYISGHGFGHASRQVEIINAFARAAARTSASSSDRTAARWLLERTIARARSSSTRGRLDTGVVQIDSLRLDAARRSPRRATFYATLDARADAEAALLRAQRRRPRRSPTPRRSAAPPRRAPASRRSSSSNFTWDWIYAGVPREHLHARAGADPDDPGGLPRAPTRAWRLPMHGGFETFARPSTDVPFVARHSRRTRRPRRARASACRRQARWCCPRSAATASTGAAICDARRSAGRGWRGRARAATQAAIYDAGLQLRGSRRAPWTSS